MLLYLSEEEESARARLCQATSDAWEEPLSSTRRSAATAVSETYGLITYVGLMGVLRHGPGVSRECLIAVKGASQGSKSSTVLPADGC